MKAKYKTNIGDNMIKDNVYANKKVLNELETSEVIQNAILDNRPYMASRFGGNELNAMISGIRDKYPVYLYEKHKRKNTLAPFFDGAGFFPRNVNLVPKFSEIMIDSCKSIDLLGAWGLPHEEEVINKYLNNEVEITRLGCLEPYSNCSSPWSSALEGKKVLVVHPFASTIKKQYEKHRDIFPGTNVLPDMELIVYKAVQTAAGAKDRRFYNWFQALEYMYNEIKIIDFDVAILGCGAYGMPLAAKLKNDGKIAIHLGGATQVLFGIKGNRWDNNEYISAFYNDNWCRPSKDETPKNVKVVENGCYW